MSQHSGGRPGRSLRLEVRDTGTGIALAHLSRIFEPFFTTKEAGKGTGLGLASVFSIAEQHDGWIEIASEPGRSTVFHVLPKLQVLRPDLKVIFASGFESVARAQPFLKAGSWRKQAWRAR
jgi:nitrogen-specific signal transduction histidine kinase